MSEGPSRNPGSDEAPRLSELDEQALDALVQSGFSIERTSKTETPSVDRAAAIARLLSLLDAPVEPGNAELLTDVTLARLALEADEHAAPESGVVVLTPLDEEAIDALVMANFDASETPGAIRSRAEQASAIGNLLRSSTEINATEKASRIDRAMVAIEADVASVPESLKFEPASSGGFRLQDLVSLAAVLLLGAAVAWPVIGTLRQRAEVATGRANLASAGFGFGAYAGDHQSALPMYTGESGSEAPAPWWVVGQNPAASNSANLYTLPRLGYVKLESLASPGNPNAITDPIEGGALDWGDIQQVSYSYRIMTGTSADSSWGANPDLVLLSDRSPVVLRAIKNRSINPFENSPNHDGRGQLMLRADGSVVWSDTPWLESGDNIWLPRVLEDVIHEARNQRNFEPISGNEMPADTTDSFVGP